MRRLLSALFLLSICITLFSTNARIDSLELLISTTSERNKPAILNKLAAEYAPSLPQKGIEYANEALIIAEKYKQKREEADAYRNLADSYYYLYQIPQSLEMYKKSAEVEREISGDKSEIYAKRLGDIGYCYEVIAQYKKAIDYYEQALEISSELRIHEEIITLQSNIGGAYYKLANYDKALEYYQNTIEHEKKFGIEKNLSVVLNSIGMIYDAWKQFEKAIGYYEQALTIDKKYNNEGRIAIRLNNIGFAYKSLKQNDKSLKYLQEALAIERKYAREEKIAIRLSNIGLIYVSTSQYEKALINYQEARTILERLNLPNYLSILYTHIGHVYIIQKKYKKAQELLDKSQKIALEKNLKQQQIQNYLEFAFLYQKIENYEKAYRNQIAYSNLRDSVFTEEKHRQFAEFETKYETEKKEKEIELLTVNSEIQDLILKRNRIVKYSFIIGFIIFVIIAFIIYRAYRAEKREIIKRKIVEKELSELNKNLEERVETEVKIKREQEQKAVEQSRLAALGELAAGIAHEINQPLHSIAFAIDNMSMAIEEDDADKEYLQKKTKNLFSDVDRMKHIIDHIRIFSRKQSEDEKEPFNINQSISNAVNMIKEQYSNHRILLTQELDENLPEILGNLYRFEQVVLILLSNGKDAIEGKAESLSDGCQKQLSIRTFQKNKKIIMEFEDNGIGIPKKNIDKIFNPFYTTKKPGQGTGLGLSIAIGIVEKMGGNIMVESEEESGTKMIVSIGTRMQE